MDFDPEVHVLEQDPEHLLLALQMLMYCVEVCYI